MRTIKISILVFFFLAAFACNNKQNKKVEDVSQEQEEIELPVEESEVKTTEIIEQKELIATEILTTSPRYMLLTKGLTEAVIKNGGLSFGIYLEGSPNPSQNKAWSYSENYEFTLYEMYPDRKLTTARFTFNPNKKLLYEYDAVKDQFIPIEFDRNLIVKYEALCN